MKLARGNYRTVPAQFYGTPKEVWDFPCGKLRGDTALRRARGFLSANRELLILRFVEL